MLSSSTTSIPDTLLQLKQLNLNPTFLVPTATGLEKSIMDAHGSVRDWLIENGVHNYDLQQQGPEHKKTIRTTIISNTTIETKTSLYRPLTKTGDPRIWPNGLKALSDEGDLLALLCWDNELIIINATKLNISRPLFESHPKLRLLLEHSAHGSMANQEASEELLQRLQGIGQRGWIQTLKSGDTGIGYTLETLLGIEANSSKAPDYKGIELKSHRRGAGSGGQVALFAKVPDWSASRLKGSKDILRERGYFSEKKQRRQLFHEISCVKPNSIGLQLSLLREESILMQSHVDSLTGNTTNDVQWAVDTLQKSLREKHKETMWVTASSRGKGKSEEFNYENVVHTSGYDQSAFVALMDTGAITVHYTITERPNGSAKDQGYLFKMAPKYLPALFARQVVHSI